MKAQKIILIAVCCLILALVVGVFVYKNLPVIILIYFFIVDPPYIDTVIIEIPSPNHQFSLVEIERDIGALGGDVWIFVRENKTRGLFRTHFNRKLYYGNWGKRPSIKWIDNDHVEINGIRLNIFESEPIRDYPSPPVLDMESFSVQ